MEQSPFSEANMSSACKEYSVHYVEPYGPLPPLQGPATCPYLTADQPSPIHAPCPTS